MSGGSFNYLCYKRFGEIHQVKETLNEMRERLTELGYTDAAKETEDIILILNSTEVRVNARIERLSSVWQAVEWFDSNDFGIDSVEKAINYYRNL